eukprot:6462651-Amphidinium_carterae.2
MLLSYERIRAIKFPPGQRAGQVNPRWTCSDLQYTIESWRLCSRQCCCFVTPPKFTHCYYSAASFRCSDPALSEDRQTLGLLPDPYATLGWLGTPSSSLLPPSQRLIPSQSVAPLCKVEAMLEWDLLGGAGSPESCELADSVHVTAFVFFSLSVVGSGWSLAR